MKAFLLHTVLNFHDEIVVFTAHDDFGGLFIFSLYDEHSSGASTYLGFQISSDEFVSLITSRKDLKQAYLDSKDSIFYEGFFKGGNNIEIIKVKYILDEEDLPGENIYFNINPNNFKLLNKAILSSSPYFTLTIENEINSHLIPSEVGGGILINLSKIWDSSFKKTVTQNDKSKQKSQLLLEAQEEGSFEFVFKVPAPLNLFESNTTVGFDLIFNIIDDNNDENEVLEFVKLIRGHGATALISLLSIFYLNRFNVKFSYADPAKKYFRDYVLKGDYANILYNIISSIEELEEEPIEAEGFFKDIKTKTDSWTFVNRSNNKEIKGKLSNDVSLDGLTVITKKYKISYLSLKQQETKSNNPKTINSLLSVEEIGNYSVLTPTSPSQTEVLPFTE